MCPPGSEIVVTGEGPPRSALLLTFDQRIVGGGSTDAGGRFRIPLAVGNERPGYYTVTVQVRGTKQFDHKLRQINGGLTFVADEVIAKGVAIDPAVDRPGEGVVACRVALSERKPPEKRIPTAPGDRPHWDENR